MEWISKELEAVKVNHKNCTSIFNTRDYVLKSDAERIAKESYEAGYHDGAKHVSDAIATQ